MARRNNSRWTQLVFVLAGLSGALAVPAARAQGAAALTLDPKPAQLEEVARDLKLILTKAALPLDSVELGQVTDSRSSNRVTLECTSGGKIRLNVAAEPAEWSSTFYLGLQKLGFLFPHPRIQLSPSAEEFAAHEKKFCGQAFVWRPRLRFRGFHLHTEHPSEWVRGFLQGDEAISQDTVRWLARNGQNVLQVVLLRTVSLEDYQRSFRAPFALAEKFGILTGASVSFGLTQQKSYKLLPFFSFRSKEDLIRSRIEELARAIHFDYLDVELGSTEFTSPSSEQTLRWIEAARQTLAGMGKSLFLKIHVSVNQQDPHFGNFNFIPSQSNPSVGVQPHTVMFYALDDPHAPVYGRKDFRDMKEFLIRENQKRPTWYFPETSYFVAMDIDVPLVLTDYLDARSRDMDLLEANHVPGQVTFTTGQELGYWLLDWTVALLVNGENRGQPWIGLKLLGEDLGAWKKISDFETRYFKDRGLIAELSSAIIIDELPWPFQHKLHERFTFGELAGNIEETHREAALLEAAVKDRPALEGVRNPELKALLQVTWLRVEHARDLRQAMLAQGDEAGRKAWTDRAREAREQALKLMQGVTTGFSRYPEAKLFEPNRNPTSYQFGYGWTAATLHFWEREEDMARSQRYSPFFMNIYDIWNVLF